MALYPDQEHEKTYHIRIHFNITLQTGLYIINYSVYIALFIRRSELQWRRSEGEFLCCQARPKGHIFREIKQQNGFSSYRTMLFGSLPIKSYLLNNRI